MEESVDSKLAFSFLLNAKALANSLPHLVGTIRLTRYDIEILQKELENEIFLSIGERSIFHLAPLITKAEIQHIAVRRSQAGETLLRSPIRSSLIVHSTTAIMMSAAEYAKMREIFIEVPRR